MSQVDWARELSRSLLQDQLPRRWSHTQGVAQQAATVAPLLGSDADMLVAAAWLHDIGYSPGLVDVDFHPLDGARYLRALDGVDDRLCRLVAFHSSAIEEAEARGLAAQLIAEFVPVDGLLFDALTYSDMTTSPDGRTVTFEARVEEILSRYGPDHLVSRCMTRAVPRLSWSIAQVDARRQAG